MNPRCTDPVVSKMRTRNVELRLVLSTIKDKPNQSTGQLMKHFEWKKHRARNNLILLAAYGLIYATDESKPNKKFYSTTNYSEADLDSRLPVDFWVARTVTRPRIVPKSKRPEPLPIMRDPLTAMLMGSQSAPSLNFIDSMNRSQAC